MYQPILFLSLSLIYIHLSRGTPKPGKEGKDRIYWAKDWVACAPKVFSTVLYFSCFLFSSLLFVLLISVTFDVYHL